MARSDNRKALQQLAGLGVLVALVAGLARWASLQPDRDADLRVVVEELEAETAELDVLRAGDPRDVPAGFRSRHERQLAQDFERTSHELVSLDVIPELRARHERIVAADLALEPIFVQTPADAGPPSERPQLRALRQELRAHVSALSR